MNCRVGKGRPAGSIELRVSPSPSKIPYGGFSPVRLQMDRQWRPSTTSRGLSAVHIRLMRPSYTPPQLQLPGIRDPRRDYPFENLSVQCGTTPQQLKHVHPEALCSPSGYVVPTGHRLLRPNAGLLHHHRKSMNIKELRIWTWVNASDCPARSYAQSVAPGAVSSLLQATYVDQEKQRKSCPYKDLCLYC